MFGLEIKKGAIVYYQGHPHEIVKYLGKCQIIIANVDSGVQVQIDYNRLETPPGQKTRRVPHWANLTSEQIRRIEWFKDILAPLVGKRNTVEKIETQAKNAGVSVATIYRWLAVVERTGNYAILLRPVPTGGQGKGRLPERVEEILEETIKTGIKARRKKKTIYNKVRGQCEEENLPAPSYPTFKKRYDAVPEGERTAARSRSEAKTKYQPKEGTYDDAKWPGSIVQIDHTPFDILIVGDLYGLPIGRPWATFAIDVYSRYILGYYLAMEAPSVYSVGNCLTYAILQKEEFLLEDGRKIFPMENEGFPDIIHADNGPEFRCEDLTSICRDYGMDIFWRPRGRCEYGGHIESLLGKFQDKIKELPGATFSSPEERGDYNSKKHASLTFENLRHWLLCLISEYNRSRHSQIERVPHSMYFEGIYRGVNNTFSDDGFGARGIRPAMDPQRVKIDFLPREERTIQRNGIAIDTIQYTGEELSNWIYQGSSKGKKFRCHRVYSDISYIFLYDPEADQYIKLFGNKPPMSKWEYESKRKENLSDAALEIKSWETEVKLSRKARDKIPSQSEKIKEEKLREQQKRHKKIASKISPPDKAPPEGPKTSPIEKPLPPSNDIEYW